VILFVLKVNIELFVTIPERSNSRASYNYGKLKYITYSINY